MGQRGFTLVELLVVIAIIGILAAAAIPQITGAICDAQGASAESAIASARTAFTQCKADGLSSCGTISTGNYANYLSSDAIDSLSVTNSGGSLKTVTYSGVGCSYDPDGDGSGSSEIVWNSATGNISNP